MGIETAILGSAVIGGASSLFGANKAEKAAKKAAKVSAQQYADTKASVQPFISSGTNALGDLLKSLGLSGETAEERLANQQGYFDDFQYDAGFQSFLDDSNKNAMRAYSLYGDTGGNLANALRKNSEGAIYGQHQDRRNALAGLVNSGQSAALSLGGIGANAANTQGNFISQAGQIGGAGIVNAGNAVAGGLNNMAGYGQFQQGLAAGQNPWTAQTVNRASW